MGSEMCIRDSEKPRRLARTLLAVGEMGRKDLGAIHDFDIVDRGRFE